MSQDKVEVEVEFNLQSKRFWGWKNVKQWTDKISKYENENTGWNNFCIDLADDITTDDFEIFVRQKDENKWIEIKNFLDLKEQLKPLRTTKKLYIRVAEISNEEENQISKKKYYLFGLSTILVVLGISYFVYKKKKFIYKSLNI
jgi:hypothetical protein